jgi:hypothetical protein
MKLNIFFIYFSLAALLVPANSSAWGPAGHRIVGVEAINLLDARARASVIEILGGDSADLINEACSWPDAVRKTPEWEWSAPLHYVNIARNSGHFDRQRDCPDGLCVTDALARYTNDLANPSLTAERRWQAFAWVCHLAGDLHQPLHAGYRDDRGGNYVEIEYRGETANLHQFWDRVLIRSRLGPNDAWERPCAGREREESLEKLNAAEFVVWTDESHALAERSAYPSSRVIDEPFAEESWLIVRRQWQKASWRLARILNATLGEGEIIPDR